jgi:hypothetical protein
MSDISVGSAVGAGFQLIGRRPVSVLVWGLLRVAFVAAVFALYAPVLMGVMAEIASKAQTGAQPTPADMSQITSHMFLLQGVGYLAQFVGLFISSIVTCAIARSVIHPERRAFASLRLGAPEFFMVILSFAAGFVLVFAIMIFAIPFAILGVFLGMQHLWVPLAVMIGVAALILVLGLIYIAARFAFVAPMMVDDGRFHLFDAWSLTKGRVGSIVLVGVCLALIAMVLGLVIDGILVGLGAAALGFADGGFNNLQAFFTQTPPQQIIMTLAPSLVLLGLLLVPIQGAAMAIFIAPWARAYRDVVPTSPLAPTSGAAAPLAPSSTVSAPTVPPPLTAAP